MQGYRSFILLGGGQSVLKPYQISKRLYIGSKEWLYRKDNDAIQTTLLRGGALQQEPLRGSWATVIVGALIEQLSLAETFFNAGHLGRHICRRTIDSVSRITSLPIVY
jgi:hypothetical protein